MKRHMWFLVGALLVATAGCSKRVSYCSGDSDCTDPAYPFCDVDGEYAASGGEKNTCTIVPPDCPVERCGCTPGAVVSCSAGVAQTCGSDGMSQMPVTCAEGCSGDETGCVACTPGASLSCSAGQATECAPDGMSQQMATCSLGCASDGTRCHTFTPSNGLATALAMAAGQPDVVLPAGTKIDTDMGTVEDAMGNSIAIQSVLVAQPGAANIRAFYAGSITTEDVTVTGTAAFALVATGPITIGGLVDASGHGATAGPGAQEAPAACTGVSTQAASCAGIANDTAQHGPGGGGHATQGGTGGGYQNPGEPGGASYDLFTPLAGGCRGGSIEAEDGSTVLDSGGGGGGAIEIVSLQSVTLTGNGMLDVGGGGSPESGGGGSAGTIVIEAPQVTMSGTGAGLVANGGAVGCGSAGDGTLTTQSAQCADGNAAGGTSEFSPGFGGVCTGFCALCILYPGGGGAAGLARITTKDGTYFVLDGAVISVAITSDILQLQ